MFTQLKKIVLSLTFLSLSFAFAEETALSGLYRYKLDNGLELFIAENTSAPLAYIELAVKAGAVTQTPQTAGLFHLYEHMLFKGNEKYENQQEFTKAENRMGVIDENGSTGVDRVNYYFTLPSSLVKRGLEFWSYAIRTPKLDEKELENEKAVVLAEINADFSDHGHMRMSAISKYLFPENAWRLDPGGSPAVVTNATVQDLRDMQQRFYTPENSAIFVGGDVKHEEVYEYVKEIFGNWQNSPGSIPFQAPSTKEPFSKDKKIVVVDSGNSDSIINVSYYLRGPDGETEEGDTYAADVWSTLVSSPNSTFSKTMVGSSILSIPESDYVGAHYSTRRASGMIGFFGAMVLNSSVQSKKSVPSAAETNYGIGSFKVISTRSDPSSPVDKADSFLSIIKRQAVPEMLNKETFFAATPLALVKQQLEDSRVYELESAKSILASLSASWASCSSDYFFNYDKNIEQVSEDDVVSFIEKYISNKNGLLVVSVSPAVWANYKSSFLGHGYEQVTAENAFWQNDLTR